MGNNGSSGADITVDIANPETGKVINQPYNIPVKEIKSSDITQFLPEGDVTVPKIPTDAGIGTEKIPGIPGLDISQATMLSKALAGMFASSQQPPEPPKMIQPQYAPTSYSPMSDWTFVYPFQQRTPLIPNQRFIR